MKMQIIREKRKTMRLTVTREGMAVVYAPPHVSEERIREFVERHARWLEKRLTQTGEVSLADGEILPIEGRERTIRTGARAALGGDTLTLPAKEREAALVALLKRRTRVRMGELLARISAAYGIGYASLRVSSARGRWGSCSGKGTVSFTFRTEFLPDELAEYLAVHELCHRLEMNHSKRFWMLVERILPDWKARRRALKQYFWAMNAANF